jgi:hypothetical protein
MTRPVVSATLAVVLGLSAAGCGLGTPQGDESAHDASPSPIAQTGSTSTAGTGSSAKPAPAATPKGWVIHHFGPVTLATPKSWASVTLRNGKVVTSADIDSDMRKTYAEDLGHFGALGNLINTKTLSSWTLDYYVSEMALTMTTNDEPIHGDEQLVRLVREEPYVPKGAEIASFKHPAAYAAKVRYPFTEDGHKGIEIDYTLAFPNSFLYLDFYTDARGPDGDIKTADGIVQTVRLG